MLITLKQQKKKEEYLKHRDKYISRAKKYYRDNKEAINIKNRAYNKRLSSEYKTWINIKKRCYNQKMTGYKLYGGRGIKVCDRWLISYVNFLKDMGKKPGVEYSIDRINNNGNYEPKNCRWATKKQQSNNTRKNIKYTFKGLTKSITEWANYYKIPKYKIFNQLRINKFKRSLSIKQILTQYENRI